MACTLERGRMAAMARLLCAGNDPEMTLDEIGREELATQSIGQDLCNADEPNLLDEEDMHVFDCRPMADILHLVCCNHCKKPVKASQFAAHRERCSSLNCSQETFLELGGSKGHKKPPRKGKKKLQTVPSESIVSHSSVSSLSSEAKRNSVFVGAPPVNDGSEKRSKLCTTETVLISEGLETVHNVTVNTVVSYQKAPTPLAAKVYYSQRNLRIRLALNHLYHQASSTTRDHCNSGSSLGNIQQQPSGSVPVV